MASTLASEINRRLGINSGRRVASNRRSKGVRGATKSGSSEIIQTQYRNSSSMPSSARASRYGTREQLRSDVRAAFGGGV